MHRLILFRHGKSAWPQDVADFDRPLGPRGEAAVPLMARWLASLHKPDLALVSPARRTRETFAHIAPVFPTLQSQEASAIYASSLEQLFAVVRAAPEEAQTVLIVGHNPGLQELALALSGTPRDDGNARLRLRRKFPTSGVAVVEIPGPWQEAVPGAGRLVAFQTPAMLGGVDED